MPISTLQSGSFPSNVAIDTDTLVVDGASNLVGVGTSAPSGAKLEIFTASTAVDGLKINRYTPGNYYSTLRQDNHGLAIHVGTGGTVSERVAITPNGITFNGDTAAANALDDYEEGTWTPSPSSGSMQIFSSQWYTKIGNLVTCSFYMYGFSGGTSNAQVMISGLPFAFKTGTEGFFQVGFVGGINSLPVNTISITARIGQHGSNTFALYLGKVGNAYSNFQYSELGTGHYAATFSYQTA